MKTKTNNYIASDSVIEHKKLDDKLANLRHFEFQFLPKKPHRKWKNDESRYGDVTTLSVFSIRHARPFPLFSRFSYFNFTLL